MRLLPHIIAGICLCILCGCSSTRELRIASKNRSLLKAVESNPVFSSHHMGFALFDPLSEDWLCQYNADKYFIPASNTKLLTLLTCLHVLGDSIETLRYVIRNDTLFFQGMGDPSFLFPGMETSSRPFRILQQHAGSICYLSGEEIPHYGHGWAWDDYSYAFQAEKSALPMYGNTIQITSNASGELKVTPEYFKAYIQFDESQNTPLTRDPVANAFVLNVLKTEPGNTLEVPFVVSDYEITRILADTLRRPVDLVYADRPRGNYNAVFGASRDTLLKRMMQESDNFIAEQLLMQCAVYMRGTLQSDTAIVVAQAMILQGAPDPLQWVDASGLSRYNLVTPRSIVWVLDQLSQLQSMDYLTSIFPAGGRSGTLAGWYISDPPFIYAKTGALSNQHCLSGYLHADSGKWLIFSFMHNNFTRDSVEIKKEMEKILDEIRREY